MPGALRLETLIFPGCCSGLSESGLQRLEELLSPLCVDEAVVVLEQLPSSDRPVYELLSFLSDTAKRVSLLAPSSLLAEAARLAASLSAPNLEVAAVLGKGEADVEQLAPIIATAYDRGVEALSLYLLYDYAPAADTLAGRVERRTGVSPPVRIGPRPYTPTAAPGPRTQGVFSSMGLPFGLLYGYSARRALTQRGLRVTYLEPPCPRRCRRLSVSPAAVYKCPLGGGPSIPLSEASPSSLEEVASAPCRASRGEAAQPGIRVRVVVEVDGVEIPGDVLELLAAVRMTKSLRGACKTLGYDPVAMLAKLRRVERRLGRRLVKGYRGGAGGGYTVLTELGDAVVKKYLRAWARLEG